ncbi:MAG TPA: hypothetical protein VE987_15660 [Polyangiaceae bacterium]|nr:hypothetical protein [Polyangiaceae bacterium]
MGMPMAKLCRFGRVVSTVPDYDGTPMLIIRRETVNGGSPRREVYLRRDAPSGTEFHYIYTERS